ncbi:MAG: hypothetical protein KC431_10410 [Myxococcales bacterium]|nr:hypothetical protein [Myxococcales bacterium]
MRPPTLLGDGPTMAKEQRKKRGGRASLLVGLLAIVALLAVLLEDCFPGLGLGAGEDAPGEAPTQAEEPAEPAAPEAVEPAEPAAPKAATVVVDIRGCTITVGEGPPAESVDCSKLCEAEDPFAGVEQLTIDAKQGPHDAVVALLDCAKQKGIDKLAIERE